MLAMPISLWNAAPDFYHRNTIATHSTPSTRETYLPARPSPLSPRSTNVITRSNPYMSSDSSVNDNHDLKKEQADNAAGENAGFGCTDVPALSSDGESTRRRGVPFSARSVKPTPFSNQTAAGNNEVRERRRRNFLRQVGNRRDEKRFELRGEDMLRLDYLQQRRQWENQLAREAASFAADPDLYEAENEVRASPSSTLDDAMHSEPMSQTHLHSSGADDVAPDEVDEYLQWEDAELEALLDYMPEGSTALPLENEQRDIQAMTSEIASARNPWSDDEDDDALFADYMQDRRFSLSGLDQDGDEAMGL